MVEQNYVYPAPFTFVKFTLQAERFIAELLNNPIDGYLQDPETIRSA
ncbi:MAG: hypothetical protein NNA21_09485 [Nitrospira sp.]|nr:hypothetical protein [Nitrospira sp.]MCP9461688.1 hypothetical protein [Nitrospira sp.]MCP9473696.1 hypothetical protein [Nitrospira sp.]